MDVMSHPGNDHPDVKAAIDRAIRRITDCDLDNKIRQVAKSGRFDGTANWRYVSGPYEFQCTSGAGTNSAHLFVDGRLVYHVSDHGGILNEFHDGEWVEAIQPLFEQAILSHKESMDAKAKKDRDEALAKFI